jgi:hypothetical protein
MVKPHILPVEDISDTYDLGPEGFLIHFKEGVVFGIYIIRSPAKLVIRWALKRHIERDHPTVFLPPDTVHPRPAQ